MPTSPSQSNAGISLRPTGNLGQAWQFVSIERPGRQVVWIAHNLPSYAHPVLALGGHLELWWENHPHSRVGALYHESLLVRFNDQPMELFLA